MSATLDGAAEAPPADGLAERIREAVNEIPDPCSVSQGVPTGLVDMGLLCDIELGAPDQGARSALVELRLTAPGCFYAIYFEREIRARLEAMSDVGAIEVAFRAEFDWTPDDVAPHIQQRLRERRERLLAELPVAPEPR